MGCWVCREDLPVKPGGAYAACLPSVPPHPLPSAPVVALPAPMQPGPKQPLLLLPGQAGQSQTGATVATADSPVGRTEQNTAAEGKWQGARGWHGKEQQEAGMARGMGQEARGMGGGQSGRVLSSREAKQQGSNMAGDK